MKISITNETENDLIISLPNMPDNIIPSGEKKEISCTENLTEFSVKEEHVKLSNIQKFFSYVLGAIVGALLCLIHYFQIETLEKSVKFPVKISLPKSNEKDSTVIKLRDTSSMELCYAEINGTFSEPEMLISKQTLKNEKKAYYQSNITLFFVPFAVIFSLSVMTVVHFKTAIATIITVAVNVLLFSPLFVIIIKNHIFYKEMCYKVNADD